MRKFMRTAAVLLIGTTMFSTPAHAEKYALLIGVGEYSSPKVVSMPAVANDLALMVEVSQRLQVQTENIWLVASENDSVKARTQGVSPVASASREGILAQLDRMAEVAKEGDQILIYFSGHGYQAADQADVASGQDEADGLDEALAPSDTTTTEAGIPLPSTLIIDDEIDARLIKMRRQGASVWFVVDSCHSGSMSRTGSATGSTIQWKRLRPGDRVIPSESAGATRANVQDGFFLQSGDLDATGALVAFYAVPPDILAPIDNWFAEGQRSDERYSLLTFAIHRALDRGGIATYEQLGQAVGLIYDEQPVSDRKVGNLMGGFRVLPQFDGEMERPLLGSELVQARNYSIFEEDGKIKMRAGLLRFVSEGATVNVYAAAKPEDKRLFEVTSVDPDNAVLRPIDSRPLPTGGVLRGELVRNPVTMQTRVAVASPPAASPWTGAAQSALDALARNPADAVEPSASADSADLVITPGKDRVWISRGPEGPETLNPANPLQPVHVLCDDSAECQPRIEQRVREMAAASRVLRVLNTSATAALPPGLTVETFVQERPDQAEDAPCGSALQPRLASTGAFSPYSVAGGANQGIRLSHCDEIFVRVSRANSAVDAERDRIVDITGLYFGANGEFYGMDLYGGPGADGRACNASFSLRPGECMIMRMRSVRTTSEGRQEPFGAETIGLIAVTRQAQSPARYYNDIQSVPRRTVGGEFDPFQLALHAAYGAPPSRSAPKPPQPTAVMMIPIDFLPREIEGTTE